MSEVYIKEPATNGSAVLRTTHGDLEIEMWATECPKACRNFCQLILEGYYNDTIFHRIIKDFIIQGGDKTGTGEGSENIYGAPYPDEIHPRLKFRYRGMMGIASAGPGTKTNGSQFFIAMDRAPSMDRKHTLFAKIVGQTIYNLVRLMDVDIDKQDRPTDPPRIIRAELTWDPFGDLEPRCLPAAPRSIKTKEKHRREAIKSKAKLSFGDDEEGDSDDEAPAKSFSKAGSDPKLKETASSSAPSREASKRSAPKAEEAAGKKKEGAPPPTKVARRKAAESEEEGSGKEAEADYKEKASSDDSDSSSSDGDGTVDKSAKRNEEIEKLKRQIAGSRRGEDATVVKAKPKSAWEELLAGFKTRKQRIEDKPKDKKGRQAAAVGIAKEVKAFSKRVESAGDSKEEDQVDPEVVKRKQQAQEDSLASVWEEGDDESTADWLNGGGLAFHKGEDLKFKKISGKQKETLQIFDPLAAEGDIEMLERDRLRRSAQLKPSLRRIGGLSNGDCAASWEGEGAQPKGMQYSKANQ